MTLVLVIASHEDSPAIPVEQDQSRGSHKMTRHAGSPLFVLFSHWRNQRLRGDVFLWCHTGLGRGQRCYHVAASLTF